MKNRPNRFTHEQEVPACPICKSASVRTRFQTGGYRICKCRDCKVQFVHPRPSNEEVLGIYSADYFRRGNKYLASLSNDPVSVSHPAAEMYNDGTKLALVRKFKTNGSLLDIGCAMGGFLNMSRKSGYQTQGVEVAECAAEHGRSVLGLDIHTGDLNSATFQNASFDIVTMWDVIEHVPDPHSMLAEIKRVLRPGGVLFITTGDVDSVWARLTGRFWQLMTPPQHLYFYTPRSIEIVLESNGLHCHRISHDGKRATIDFIGFKAREAFGAIVSPVQWIVRTCGLGELSVRVNLGDILTCVAEHRN